MASIKRRKPKTRRNPLMALLVPAVIITAWYVASSGSTAPYYPPLSKILETLSHDWLSSHLETDLLPSMLDLLYGLLIAGGVGVFIGAVIGSSPLLYRAMLPMLDVLRSTPGVALVPVAIAILGLGDKSEIAVIAFVSLWPILLNSIDGVRRYRLMYHDMILNERLTDLQAFRYVLIPGATAEILAGFYTAISIGLLVMVASEFYSSTRGIGFYLVHAQNTFDIPATYAGAIVLGIIGYLLARLFRAIESRILKWQR